MIWYKSHSCILGLLTLLLAAPVAAQSMQMIQLGTQDLPPYQMLDDGQIVGVAMDRVTCALDRMSQPHEILMMDWSRAQLMTQNRELDGFFVGSANSARARYATPSDPVITENLAWFMLPGRTFDPESEIDKMHARFGTVFATSKWLKLKQEGYNVVKKPRDAEGVLDMLLRGEIDVAFEYEMIFMHSVQARGLQASDVRKISSQPQSSMVHFSNAFLVSNPQFLQRFNSFLEICKAGVN